MHLYVVSKVRGAINATVTGPRQYSQDLPQGGLELPCTYTDLLAKSETNPSWPCDTSRRKNHEIFRILSSAKILIGYLTVKYTYHKNFWVYGITADAGIN